MNTVCIKHKGESAAQLKRGGLKTTAARLRLLDIFKHATKPLSVKEIAKLIKGSGVDLVTLYRNVEALEKLGVIKQIRWQNPESFYELSGRHHHHLVCSNCGKIADVEGCKISLNTKQLLKQSGFAQINDHSLEFFGLCSKCFSLATKPNK